ncbi:MAG: hypothetical protein N3G20_12185, partial [Verrucomicrobiae bacterium]|nr:hypothetical protein [Verrucomicrobiae bacterium]
CPDTDPAGKGSALAVPIVFLTGSHGPLGRKSPTPGRRRDRDSWRQHEMQGGSRRCGPSQLLRV